MDLTQTDFAFRSCTSKNRYSGEDSVREAGRKAFAERGIELWIYECALCKGWHLTKQARASNWHVNSSQTNLDLYVDITGDELFWARLFDMPPQDAEYHLRAAKRYALAHFSNGSELEHSGRLGAFTRRVNDEIHFLSQVGKRRCVQTTVIALFGDDAWDRVIVELGRQQAEQADVG